MTQNTDNYGLNGDFKFSLNHGAINNEGKLGKCFSGYWIFHKDTDILADNQWTISCWMKAGSFGPNNDILMCKNNDSSEACQYYMSIINGKTFNLGINGDTWIAQYTYALTVGVWYHLAATFDGSNYKMYINGEIVKSGTCNNKYILCSNIGLGCRSTNSAGTSLTGSSDKYYNDFRIYDHCLSPKEIKLISQALVLHYPMGSIDGKIAGRNLLYSQLFAGGRTTVSSDGKSISYDKNNIADTYFFIKSTIDIQSLVGKTLTLSFISDSDGRTFSVENTGDLAFNLRVGYNSYTFVVPSNIPTRAERKILIDDLGRTQSEGTATLTKFKLELGDKSTPWTPAPEDVPQWYNNIIYDTSGYMNNGTVTDSTAPSWNNDSPRYSGCYEFNGNNSIQTSHPIFYDDINQCHTVCAWVNLTSYDSSQCLINLNLGYYITWGNQKTLMYLNDGSNDSYVYGDSLPLNEWTHVTWVLDTSIQRCEVYYNGKLNAKASNYTSSDIPKGVNKNVVIGNKFNGKLSDLRVFATALSSSDIESLYKTSASVTKNGTLLLAGEVVE